VVAAEVPTILLVLLEHQVVVPVEMDLNLVDLLVDQHIQECQM
jgi:hypothetical protein